MRIVICDDEPMYRELLHERILQYGIAQDFETEIAEYEGGEQLLAALDAGERADVYFLDIQMENGADDGIRLAKELRRRGDNGLIVYVTSFIDYAQTGYEVKAFRYLLKSQICGSAFHGEAPSQAGAASDCKVSCQAGVVSHSEALQQNGAVPIHDKLAEVLSAIRKELLGEEYFAFQIGRETLRVDKGKILYLESDRRQLYLYTESEAFCFYGGLEQAEIQLGESFLRCHKSYLVNLKQIQKYSREQISLKGGSVVPVGRSYAKECLRRLMLEMV